MGYQTLSAVKIDFAVRETLSLNRLLVIESVASKELSSHAQDMMGLQATAFGDPVPESVTALRVMRQYKWIVSATPINVMMINYCSNWYHCSTAKIMMKHQSD